MRKKRDLVVIKLYCKIITDWRGTEANMFKQCVQKERKLKIDAPIKNNMQKYLIQHYFAALNILYSVRAKKI